MNRIEDGQESYLKAESGMCRLAKYFFDHHDELVTKSDVARVLGYGVMFGRPQIYVPVSMARKYIAGNLGVSDTIVSFFGEGWASYDAVSRGQRLAPKGLLPDPYWEGDPAAIGKLRELYSSLRFATVSHDTRHAAPSLSPTLSFYLELLSHSFARGIALCGQDVEDILDITENNLAGLDIRLKAIMDRETQGHWTITHKRGNRHMSGASSLVYNG